MATSPKSPWRRDTNERYREVIRLIMGLSTASLLLPVFFARDFLAIERGTPLIAVFSWEIYVSWLALGVAVCAAILFHYFSAKWIRLAWGKPAGIMFLKNVSDRLVEALLDLTFWTSVVGFIAGLAMIMVFFARYAGVP